MNILDICNTVTNAFESVRLPMNKIPATLIALGSVNRPGISPMLVASKIISRQSEAGAPYGPNSDGSANIAEAMERIRIEEIVNALKFDSMVQIAIPPGSIHIQANGANAGGPVSVVGTNINNVYGTGIIG